MNVLRGIMNLLEETKFLLRQHRIFPKKILGQNFLIDSSIFQNMSDHASLSSDDRVLDIGAGMGFLTLSLASKCRKVLAVEADDKLAEVLLEQLKDAPNAEIIKGNVLKIQVPNFNKIVSIPPYQISSRLISWLLTKSFDRAVLVFQKEFANKLVASVGSNDYGWLTVLTYYYAHCELLDAVPRDRFYPQPKVDSIIIRLSPKRSPPFDLNNERLFTRIVQSLFTHRNRKVRNAVLPFLKNVLAKKSEDASKMAEMVPFHDRRVRELAPEKFGALANALTE